MFTYCALTGKIITHSDSKRQLNPLLLCIDSCLAYNLPHPKFEEIAVGVMVTVFKTTQKTRVETVVKTGESILYLIKEKPSITREELAKQLNLTIKGIDWNLRKLKNDGQLKRVGPKKGGHWEAQ